jgi:hypothetical protein
VVNFFLEHVITREKMKRHVAPPTPRNLLLDVIAPTVEKTVGEIYNSLNI